MTQDTTDPGASPPITLRRFNEHEQSENARFAGIELSLSKLDDHLKQAHSDRTEMRSNIRCLKRGFEEFAKTYEPFLRQSLTESQRANDDRHALILHVRKWIVVVAITLAATVAWFALHSYFGVPLK